MKQTNAYHMLISTKKAPSDPTITVIIPSHNTPKEITRAVESVLSQTYQGELQVIIVDDGSAFKDGLPDGTADNVINTFRSKVGITYKDETRGYPVSCSYKAAKESPYAGKRSIQIIRQENKGEATACNRAFKDARGDFIAYLNSSDAWLPEKLKVQMDYMMRSPKGAWLCLTNVAKDQKNAKPGNNGGVNAYPRDIVGRENKLNLEKFAACGGTVVTSTWVLPRDVVERVGGFDPNLRQGQDYDFMIRLLRTGGHLLMVNQPLTKYAASKPGRVSNLVAASMSPVFTKHSTWLKNNNHPFLRLLWDKIRASGPSISGQPRVNGIRALTPKG